MSNYVETALVEALMLAEGDRPILRAVDADPTGIEATDDDGFLDPEKTAVIRDLVAITRRR